MARDPGFGRTLGFGALAALALPAALALGAPCLGVTAILRGAIAALAVAYLAVLARGAPGRLPVAAAAALAAALLLLPLGVASTALGAAALVALGRVVLLRGPHPLRALAVEAALAAGGLAVAALLAGPGPLSLGLAVWGYFLVQSAGCLLGPARDREPPPDPFDRARTRLLRLLGEAPGRG